MGSVTRQVDAKPAKPAAECHHNKRTFDMGYADVVHRKDLSLVARVLHPYLVTLTRTDYANDRYPTQKEIGERVGLTRHQVWAGLRELVRAGLIVSIRPGLGHPNYYQLIGDEDPSVEHPSGPETALRPDRPPHSGQAGNLTRAGTYDPKKKRNGRKGTNYDTKGGRSGRAAQDSGSGEAYRTQDGVPLTEAQRACFAPLGSRPSQGAAETFEDWQERAQREYWARPENRPSQGAAETYVELQERRQREHQARPENRPSQRPASKDYLETRAPGGTDYLETRYGRLKPRDPEAERYCGLCGRGWAHGGTIPPCAKCGQGFPCTTCGRGWGDSHGTISPCTRCWGGFPCTTCNSTLHRTEEHESTRAR